MVNQVDDIRTGAQPIVDIVVSGRAVTALGSGEVFQQDFARNGSLIHDDFDAGRVVGDIIFVGIGHADLHIDGVMSG